MEPVVEQWAQRLRALVAGRRVIVAGAPLAGLTSRMAGLRQLGAQRCFAVANGVGTGDLPDPADAEWLVLDIHATEVMEELRKVERLLADPPTEVVTALDQFDPDHTALVLVAPFVVSEAIGTRPVYGGRRPEWVALEDKTVADRLFDAAGIAGPPAAVVPARRSELLAAAGRLDRGDGTVWAGDAREGFNGGGELVRWIRPDRSLEDVDEAVDRLSASCDRARVSPFIEGIPASIHGFVCDDGVAVLRPVEQVNLRPPSGSRFRYAGCATFYDPPPGDRETMRKAALGMGAHLAAEHGFRGAFTIDGIVGAGGWLPTELNPRFGAGLGYVNGLIPDLAFDLLHHLVAAGEGAEVRAADVEHLIVPLADHARWGGGWCSVTTSFDRTEAVSVRFEDGGSTCLRTANEEEADGEILIGPGNEGGFIRVNLDPTRTPAGPSVAPRIVAALAFADAELGTSIGPLTPPTESAGRRS